MSLRLVTPPAAYPITLAEAKSHLRVTDDSEDTLIQSYIAAATAYVEGYTGLALMEQTWELVLDAFSDATKLTKGPVQSISFVKYYDADSVLQTVETTNYALDNVSDPAWLVRATDYSWPTLADGVNNVVVRFVAGYEEVPSDIKVAILLLIGFWFANRETVNIGNISTNLPFTVDALLNQHRPVFV